MAGEEGLINGATWGLIIALISTPVIGAMVLAKYWGVFGGRYSQWYVKKEAEGEDN